VLRSAADETDSTEEPLGQKHPARARPSVPVRHTFVICGSNGKYLCLDDTGSAQIIQHVPATFVRRISRSCIPSNTAGKLTAYLRQAAALHDAPVPGRRRAAGSPLLTPIASRRDSRTRRW